MLHHRKEDPNSASAMSAYNAYLQDDQTSFRPNSAPPKEGLLEKDGSDILKREPSLQMTMHAWNLWEKDYGQGPLTNQG